MKLKKLCGITAIALTVSGSLIAEEKIVNFYNWADYIDPEVLATFEKNTGIRVNYDVFDSNEVLEAKMLTGGSGYDVVVPAAAFLERQAKVGVYSKIDKSKLTNLANIDQVIAKKTEIHDAANSHNVPYTWGTVGLGYNAQMLKDRIGDVPVDSWDVLFKPELATKLADCGIVILDSPAEIISIALNYLGLDPNSENKGDFQQAIELITGIRDYVTRFDSSRYGSDLANGDACLAVGYNGDILMAQATAEESSNGIEVGYAIPEEGTIMWLDLLAIPADAPHPEAAHQLLDFLLSPEGAAGISNYSFFAVPNNKVEPLLLEEVRTNPSIYPGEAIKENLFPQKAHTAKFDRLLTRAWTVIKTGK